LGYSPKSVVLFMEGPFHGPSRREGFSPWSG
jgi:hypothetical protein